MRRSLALAPALLLAALLPLLPGTAAAFPGAAPEVRTLKNGLRVVLRPDHSKPLVAACVFVDSGARTEPEHLKGLSHYYEHTVFRGGTAKQAELETRKRFRRLGDFSGYTNFDETAYFFLAPTSAVDEAWERWSDAILGLEVTAEKIERDRQSVVQEFHMRVDDRPPGRAWQLLWQTAFTKHNYRVGPIGLLSVIEGATLDTFRTFYEERYVPNRFVLAVVGDFEPAAMLQRIEASFGKAKRGPRIDVESPAEPAQREYRERLVSDEAKLSYIDIGWHIPAAAHPDMPALAVLETLLAGAPSSLLDQALTVDRDLATEVWSHAARHKDPALFVLGLQVRPEAEQEALEVTLEAVRSVIEGRLGEVAVERARRAAINAFLFENEAFDKQAQTLAHFALVGGPGGAGGHLEALRTVGPADVVRVAKAYLDPALASVAAVRPKRLGEGSFRRIFTSPPGATGAALRPASGAGPARFEIEAGPMVVVDADPGAGLAAAVAVVRGGQHLEGINSRGSAEMLSRLLQRGTERRDAGALAQALDGLGARLSTSAGRDEIVVALEAPAGTFEEAYSLFLEILFRPALAPEQVARVRATLLAEIAAIDDDSFAVTDRALHERLLVRSPYRFPLLGLAGDVEQISRGDLRRLHNRAFVPGNVVIAVAGAADPVRIERATRLGLVGAPEGGPPSWDPVAEAGPAEPFTHVIEKPVSQVTFDLATVVPGHAHEDHLPLVLARSVLGSRLFFKHVYEDGVAYRMWTRYATLASSSPFKLQMGIEPDRYEAALATLRADVRAFVEGPIPKAELDDAKAEWVQRFRLRHRTAKGRAGTLARFEARGWGVDRVRTLPDEIGEISMERVRAAARRHLHPDRLSLVVVKPGPGR